MRSTPHHLPPPQLFYSFFKTLIDHEVIVICKNDVRIRGKLISVDQYLSVKLQDIQVLNAERFPQMQSTTTCFIRGSVIRYIELPAAAVDTALLQDAARKACLAQA
ncbi:hypothetical protein CXG81DRAFT_11459 [Caulochytrium protostelioides]|uniref:Sm domain-containing protein n=1 Tax=Caulochytrium protostelioides TaxID=1555241 RepID=A0A4P9X9A0_9FUNG|nr:hypothetical protein CXG81DRAFT_11459 [Caulochytrium protostelioides]|eukprot:RKP01862.1 hypothetical protein CXG81DRAFT_11459 [Caulochytrium protostelioides]